MEKIDVLGMDGVGHMELMNGKEDITEVTPVKFGDELKESSIIT
jgi:hypothetical protein